MKRVWGGLGILLVGLGLLGLCIWAIVEESTFFAACLLMLGGGVVYGGYLFLKTAIVDLKERLAKEKETGEKTAKKEITKHVVLTAMVLVLAISAVVLGTGAINAADLNDYAGRVLEKPFSEDTLDDLAELEQRVSTLNPVERLFFAYGDEIETRKSEYYAKIRTHAEEISRGIDALPVCTKIESKAHYLQLCEDANKLCLDNSNGYEAEVRKAVTNYEKLEQHIAQIEHVRENYKHTCGNCNGSGGFVCTSCGGGGGKSCSSCGGSGKKLVTWYSHGDWGEKSYTSYKCTSCNGRGRRDCASCNGGRRDCSSCDNGCFYIYEDGKS